MPNGQGNNQPGMMQAQQAPAQQAPAQQAPAQQAPAQQAPAQQQGLVHNITPAQMWQQQAQQQAQILQQMQPLLQTQQPYYLQPLMQDWEGNENVARLTPYMQSHHLRSVRAAVEQCMPQAYQTIDQIRLQPQAINRVTRLHHSRGTQLMHNNQNDVLEFDIAGSGFKQFRSDYMGIKGKEDHLRNYMRIDRTGIRRFLLWLPGVTTHKQRQAKQRAEQQLQMLQLGHLQWNALSQDEQHNIKVLYRWRTHIGKSQKVRVDGKMEKRKHIRKIVHGSKTRITMAGPLALSGASNSGEYSIENLRQYMLTMGQDYLMKHITRWQQGVQPHDVWLRIRGHSRGAVASLEGAMMIKYWLDTTYPQYTQYIKFDVTQYDPVPGAGSYRSHASIDVEHNPAQQTNRQMAALDNAETTVVYSMHTEHKHHFTPQQVQNTKRIILTPYAHSVSLGLSDHSTAEAHRTTLTYAATGEAYRIGSLNELPAGVYVVDEHNTLVRLDDEAQWISIRDHVLHDVASSQRGRHRVLNDVVHTWFATH